MIRRRPRTGRFLGWLAGSKQLRSSITCVRATNAPRDSGFTIDDVRGIIGHVRHQPPQKITFVDMREQGARGILVCFADCTCSHSIALSADGWPDDLQLSDLEPRFICKACGKWGADVRPDFNWSRTPVGQRGYL
jgi:hypothetical protein